MNRDRSRSPRRDDRRRGGRDMDRGGRFDPHSDKMVYITNLPYEMNWMDLKDVIRDKGGDVSFVEILKNKDGKSKGVAVVEFSSKESAQKTIEILHRESVQGRVISAKEIRDPQAFFRRIKEESGVDFLNRDRRSDGVGRPRDRRASPILRGSNETYGLSSTFLDSLNLKPPLVNRVFVTNIDYACGVGKLYDVFSMAGKITWLDLQLDKEGKTKGMAIVEYSHPIEGVQAISMLNGQRLFDRTITVKMDRFEKDQDRDRQGLPNGLRGVGMGLGANGSPLVDIASVIGQIGGQSVPPAQPIQPFQTNGNGAAQPAVPPVQVPAQPFAGYQQPQAATPSVFDNSYQSTPSYAPLPRQLSPQASYYGQSAQNNYNIPAPDSNQPVYPKQGGYSAPAGVPYEKKQAQTHYSSNSAARPVQSSYLPAYDHPSRTVLIKNLPHDYTWDVIAQRVRQIGDFESVELVSSGVAKVRFVHVQDGERAKTTLHNTMVESNVIAVDYVI